MTATKATKATTSRRRGRGRGSLGHLGLSPEDHQLAAKSYVKAAVRHIDRLEKAENCNVAFSELMQSLLYADFASCSADGAKNPVIYDYARDLSTYAESVYRESGCLSKDKRTSALDTKTTTWGNRLKRFME